MKHSASVCILLIPCFLVLSFSCKPAQAGKSRPPAWAGKFYPASPSELERTIKNFCKKTEGASFTPPSGNHPLKALILPHAGYVYSGQTAAYAALAMEGKTYKKIVLMGPDHRVGFQGASVTACSSWDTPLGNVPIHPDSGRLLALKTGRFKTISQSDREEHSLEVIVPFLQVLTPGFQLVPVVLGKNDAEGFAGDLRKVIDMKDAADTLLVVSSDLSHYLPQDRAIAKDGKTVGCILNLDENTLSEAENAACGITPILVLIHMAKELGWKPFLIHRTTSYETSGDKDNVVGYAAIAFYGGYAMTKNTDQTTGTFTEDQGKILLKLARKTIADKLGAKNKDLTVPADPAFSSKRGTFVTLKINHELRGCIGNLGPDERVIDGIRRNAVNAAFNDYRFNPLTPEELDKVDIEVSILTEAKPLDHTGGKDLLSKLRPGVDGVIIRKGGAGATFLPQVWEQVKIGRASCRERVS
jgi:AmmeMemoRadiSam system protein B/AmmeMemoRadiSam system protein A